MSIFNKIIGLFSKGPRHSQDFDQSSLQDTPSGWALPPLTSQEAQAVLTESEYAALEATPDDDDKRFNPHPVGSREHRLWAENFNAVQRALGKKR